MHNRRDYEKFGKPIPENIDQSKTHENITLVDMEIREAYREIFGEALEKYNENKKPCRKITDYYDHILKSKNGEKPFYEDVVQWGSMKDFKDSPEMREKAKEALLQYAKGFQARNPNLRLVGAYIHMDEASPHLHLDYVPVAHGYKNGLQVRNSLDRAMKEMGFIPDNENRKNNATMLWKEHERSVLGDICRSMGLEVEEEISTSRKSLSVEEYKTAKDAFNEAFADQENEILANTATIEDTEYTIMEREAELKDVMKQLSQAKVEFDSLTEDINRLKAEREDVSDVILSFKEDERYQLIKELKKLRAENNLFKEFLEKVVPQVVRDLWDDFCKKVRKKEKLKDDRSR